MSDTLDLHSLDDVLPAGELYWDPEDDQRRLTGEIYLGNTPAFTTPISTNTVEKWDDDAPTQVRAAAVTTRITRDIAFTCNHISPFVLGLFMMAEAAAARQAGGSQTGAPINGGGPLLGGRIYQLGQDPAAPAGVRQVSDVVITADPANADTAAKAGTDYTLDAERGRITITPGGALDGKRAAADYTLAASEWAQIRGDAFGSKYGALRYIATQAEGPKRDIYIPRIMLTPNGEAAWKDRENWQALQFQGMVLTRYGQAGRLPQMLINGQPVATE